MTVVQLANHELAVISPIQMSQDLLDQLNLLGPVGHIIAPNLYHYLFASEFKTHYPKAIFWAAPGLDLKKPDLPIDRIIEPQTTSLWDGLEMLYFDGVRILELSGFAALNEWVFFHPASRTLILTDTAFYFDEGFPWVTQFAAKLLRSYKNLQPSLLEKVATTETQKVKQSVEQILTWDFERVIVAHGTIVEQKGKARLKQGYEWFLSQSIYA